MNSVQLAHWAEIQNRAKSASVNMTPSSEIALVHPGRVRLQDLIFCFSILAFPTVMLLLLIGIWIGHKVKVITTHKDLNDIQKEYQSNPRCGFWVAELISGDAQQMHCKTKQIDIIRLLKIMGLIFNVFIRR